jgi:large subunit ribosomal protein LP0
MINISPSDILKTFQSHVTTLAALSLGANLPNAASAPHMVANAFKDLLAIGLGADIKFKQLEAALSAGPAPTSAPAKAGGAAAPKQEEKPAEPEPEENVSMGGLFD